MKTLRSRLESVEKPGAQSGPAREYSLGQLVALACGQDPGEPERVIAMGRPSLAELVVGAAGIMDIVSDKER